MAEPIGTDDIEDVVSSVRRLVSPDARPRPVSRDLGMEKLLLTPALRVLPDEQHSEMLVLTEQVADAAPAAVPLAGDDALSVAEAVSADNVADMAADPAPAAEPTPDLPPAASAVIDVAEAPLQVVDGEWEDAFWSEPEPALAEIALGAEEAELIAVADAPTAQDLDEAPEPEPEPQPQPAAVLPFPQVEAAATVAGDRDTSESLAGTGLTDADGNPVMVLDETALNEIVRALVREELQGALGERITRNVRKLVRAEINRAMTARALD